MTVVVVDEDDEVLFLAFGADDVGPPRALEEAVADAYEPAARLLLLRCCFDDLPLTFLFSLEEEEVEVDDEVASADSESLPLEEPLLMLSPLFDDDDFISILLRDATN